ncbi:hypothetical protein PJP07_30650, partial [Mycobacterium kansasii]
THPFFSPLPFFNPRQLGLYNPVETQFHREPKKSVLSLSLFHFFHSLLNLQMMGRLGPVRPTALEEIRVNGIVKVIINAGVRYCP